jgi:hypothetical protein
MTPLIASTCALWSLWQRRRTFRFRFEVGPTWALLLLTLAVFLRSPVTTPLSHEINGVWHLDDYLGHCCYMAAVTLILHHVLRRLVPDEQVAAMFLRYAWTAPVALVVMFFAFANSRLSSDDASDILVVEPDESAALYWTAYAGTLSYLMFVTGNALIIVRRDPRVRRVASVWIVGMALGITGCIMVWIDQMDTNIDLSQWVRAILCIGVIGFAVITSWGWRRKMRPYRSLLQAVSQRDSL